MPTADELRAGEGNSGLATAVGRHGGYVLWSERLGYPQSGGSTHVGGIWERREAAFFRALGFEVVEQRTQEVFDLLVDANRVDVKAAHWSDYGSVRGYVFNLKARDNSARCEFFDMVCIDDSDEVAHRFIVPVDAAPVSTITITQRTLDGQSKYSEFADAVDLLRCR